MNKEPNPLLLGVDIGGTSLRISVAESPETIIGKRKISSLSNEAPQVIVDAISRTADELLDNNGVGHLTAVGLSAAGPVDISQGRIMNSPHLRKFKNVPLRDMLQKKMGVPVAMENDATASVLAEHRIGHGQGLRDMVYITVSTGIGGGIIAGGEVYRGARGAAGEVGHMTIDIEGPRCGCGRRGCWESLVSGSAIAREAARRLEEGEESLLRQMVDDSPGTIDTQMVHQAALKGDAMSEDILKKASYYLGVGLANVVNIFNPQLVTLGGGLTQMGDYFLAPAYRVCRERVFPLHAMDLRVEATDLGDEIAMLGALSLAEELAKESRS